VWFWLGGEGGGGVVGRGGGGGGGGYLPNFSWGVKLALEALTLF